MPCDRCVRVVQVPAGWPLLSVLPAQEAGKIQGTSPRGDKDGFLCVPNISEVTRRQRVRPRDADNRRFPTQDSQRYRSVGVPPAGSLGVPRMICGWHRCSCGSTRSRDGRANRGGRPRDADSGRAPAPDCQSAGRTFASQTDVIGEGAAPAVRQSAKRQVRQPAPRGRASANTAQSTPVDHRLTGPSRLFPAWFVEWGVCPMALG